MAKTKLSSLVFSFPGLQLAHSYLTGGVQRQIGEIAVQRAILARRGVLSDDLAGEDVLVVGNRFGEGSTVVAQRNAGRILGIDPSSEQVEMARRLWLADGCLTPLLSQDSLLSSLYDAGSLQRVEEAIRSEQVNITDEQRSLMRFQQGDVLDEDPLGVTGGQWPLVIAINWIQRMVSQEPLSVLLERLAIVTQPNGTIVVPTVHPFVHLDVDATNDQSRQSQSAFATEQGRLFTATLFQLVAETYGVEVPDPLGYENFRPITESAMGNPPEGLELVEAYCEPRYGVGSFTNLLIGYGTYVAMSLSGGKSAPEVVPVVKEALAVTLRTFPDLDDDVTLPWYLYFWVYRKES